MKAFEFLATLDANRTLPIPQPIAAQLPMEGNVRVIVLVPGSDEDAAWDQLTAQQFLKGYADSDAIYNDL